MRKKLKRSRISMLLTFYASIGVIVHHPVVPAPAGTPALQPWPSTLELVFALLTQGRVTNTSGEITKKKLISVVKALGLEDESYCYLIDNRWSFQLL